MALPSLEQYNEAVQTPSAAFYDPELKTGTVKTSGLGIPMAACGGFALTYTITSQSSNRKYAVRCFHREARDREKRYAAISAKLSGLQSPYFVDFEFQKKGINVHSQNYPLVKMSWADGVTIGEFVDKNYKKKEALLNLGQSLRDLSDFLEQNRISHGDIQPGNIMVADNGRKIQLIDYDGMYLPELANLTSQETGHRNFQHPDRQSINPWNEKTDRFSFILLNIALDAVAASPEVWLETHSDGDKFLLGANDFIAPESSDGFALIAAIPSLKEKLAKFTAICNGAYDDIPTLDEYLNGAFIVEASIPQTARNVGYISTYPVLDGKDYDACLAHVGDMVELVGKVENVAFNYTRYNTPYYFINFSDWRGNAVKIAIWSEYLKKNSNRDFRDLQGKYISVTGLMQPPYESKRYKYSHLSISLDSNINVISKKEAKYRLNYEKGPVPQRRPRQKAKKQDNREIFSNIRGNETRDRNRQIWSGAQTGSSPQAGSVQGSPGAASGRRNNRNIFNDIKNAAYGNTGSNTQAISVICPVCHGANLVNASAPVIVKCPLCKNDYYCDPSTRYTSTLFAQNSHSPAGTGSNAGTSQAAASYSSKIQTERKGFFRRILNLLGF